MVTQVPTLHISSFPVARKLPEHQYTVYDVGGSVSKFFWDDAPNRFGFESREGQQDMAFEILDAIKDRQHILVEAGVGIGKSFAYLVPALLYNAATGKTIVVATSTIALQEQLYGDVQRLIPLLNIPADVTMVKGQTHYACRKRAEENLNARGHEIDRMILWELDQGICDRSGFTQPISDGIWNRVNVCRYNKHACFKCKHHHRCGYYAMRQDLLWSKGVIICNQDFLTSHLSKAANGLEGLLPCNIGMLIVDEAHNLEGKVRSAMTQQISLCQIQSVAEAVLSSFHGFGSEYIHREWSQTESCLKQFYQELDGQVRQQIEDSSQDMKYAERFFFRDSPELLQLLRQASNGINQLSDSVEIAELRENRRRERNFAKEELRAIALAYRELLRKYDDQLVWIERHRSGAALVYCPKNTKEIIRKLYFSGEEKTIMTSATLTNTASGSLKEQYGYFLNNTGFPVESEAYLSPPKPSPFPYDKNAGIYYCQDLPHPTREREAFIQKGAELLHVSGGKALVLFTAKTDMEEVYVRLKGMKLPYRILIQQPGASQDSVLREFKADVNSILLGTGAYWEGISIEGKSLSHLIVFRLPFPTPDPIMEYKASVAKDPLMDVQVPEMVVKLKQSVGRLIRSFSDKGIVSIIDSRLRDKPAACYRDVVWDALPIKNRTSSIKEIREFYNSLYPER